MVYDYFVAVPKSDASGTYCGCASNVDYWPVNLRKPIHSSHSRLLMATSNKSERYLATSNGCLSVVKLLSVYKVRDSAYGFRNRESEWETEPNSLFPKDSCVLLGLVLFFQMSMVWSDTTISAVYKAGSAAEC